MTCVNINQTSNLNSDFRSYVEVDVASWDPPSVIVFMVSVNVNQHQT